MILTTRPSCPSKVFHFGRISRQHRLTKNKSACAVLPESMALSASPQTLGNQRIGSPPNQHLGMLHLHLQKLFRKFTKTNGKNIVGYGAVVEMQGQSSEPCFLIVDAGNNGSIENVSVITITRSELLCRLETRSLDSLFVGLPPQTVQWHSRALLAASTVSAIANCLTDVAMPSIDFKTMEQMLASRKLHDLNSRVLKALAQLEVAGACPHEDKQKLLAAQSVLQDKQFQLSNVLNGWKGKTDSDVDVFMEETDAYLRVADYILRSL